VVAPLLVWLIPARATSTESYGAAFCLLLGGRWSQGFLIGLGIQGRFTSPKRETSSTTRLCWRRGLGALDFLERAINGLGRTYGERCVSGYGNTFSWDCVWPLNFNRRRGMRITSRWEEPVNSQLCRTSRLPVNSRVFASVVFWHNASQFGQRAIR